MKNRKLKLLFYLVLFTFMFCVTVYIIDEVFNGAVVDLIFEIMPYYWANTIYLSRDYWTVCVYILAILLIIIVFLYKQNQLKEEKERILEETQKEKTNMILYLAHDLKTPLTSILGYLSILKETDTLTEDQQKKFTDIALKKAEQLEVLVNDFFDLSKLSLSEEPMKLQRIDLTVLILQTVEEFYPQQSKKDLKINTKTDDEIYFSCEPGKMARVFENILKNAINYCDEHTEISLEAHKEKNKIIVSIESTGAPISDYTRSHMFDNFYRGDVSENWKSVGSGLGLAIAKQIVELHGGNIFVEASGKITRIKVVFNL